MQQRLLVIGEIEGEDHYFSKVCQKIFSSTPEILKNEQCESEVLLRARDSDVVFILIDQHYSYYYELSSRIKRESSAIQVVWIAENGQYALPAFESNIDGYFELPVTEAKLGVLKKRLRM